MGIIYDESKRIFHLFNKELSYIIKVHEGGHLIHLYYGRRIKEAVSAHLFAPKGRCSFSPNPVREDTLLTFDDMPREYPTYGQSDYREPALIVQTSKGDTITDLRYVSFEILEGKAVLAGLPSTYVEDKNEATSMVILLKDTLTDLEVRLTYTVFESYAAVTRSVRCENKGIEALEIKSIMSTCLDLESSDFDFVHLQGAWCRERHIERKPLFNGCQSIDSKRGASSHQHNPFIALADKSSNETQGDVYGFSLVYSGNFIAQAEVDQFGNTRVLMGMNPFDFSWLLDPGEAFQSPECVMVFSHQGFGEMSRTYHELYRNRLCRGPYRNQVRPVLINNWEATYFDFDGDKLMALASEAKALGVELFVLDDGWFGKRNNDDSSLGDWTVDGTKLPEGLAKLAEKMNGIGLDFGLWFEPEMVSPDSDLYREHPDWCLHVEGRQRTEGRKQLILDLSRKDVCEYVIESVTAILSSANIRYVKWDMNRNMTEIGSALLPNNRQRETAHRYMLGLYQVMENLTSKFPEILFESCSGGGGRFDPGMLHYMPQTWTSDDTDAVERLKIQYGTSMVYPISTMGAHVSAVPNHQVHRMTSLKMRGDVAMSGNLGYELDLSMLSAEEKSWIKEQISNYKSLRPLIQFGDFYRLKNPFETNECGWMYVSRDKKEAFVAYFKVLSVPNDGKYRLKLQGLDPDFRYEVEEDLQVHGGDALMFAGIMVPELKGDFQSHTLHLKVVSDKIH